MKIKLLIVFLLDCCLGRHFSGNPESLESYSNTKPLHASKCIMDWISKNSHFCQALMDRYVTSHLLKWYFHKIPQLFRGFKTFIETSLLMCLQGGWPNTAVSSQCRLVCLQGGWPNTAVSSQCRSMCLQGGWPNSAVSSQCRSMCLQSGWPNTAVSSQCRSVCLQGGWPNTAVSSQCRLMCLQGGWPNMSERDQCSSMCLSAGWPLGMVRPHGSQDKLTFLLTFLILCAATQVN